MAEYYPEEGFVWNPLKRHRNIPCPCGSGEKAKRCCGRFPVLPKDVAAAVSAALKNRARK